MSGKDKLLALINSDNPFRIPLTHENVALSLPTIDNGEGWNTKVTVSAIPGQAFKGTVDVYYHRIGLTELGENIGFLSELPFTPETIVSMLNEKREADLALLELDEIIVPAMAVGDMETVVLAAQSDSYAWVGQTAVSLFLGLPEGIDDLYVLTTQTFPSDGYLTRM